MRRLGISEFRVFLKLLTGKSWCVLFFVVKCDSTEGNAGFKTATQCRHSLPKAAKAKLKMLMAAWSVSSVCPTSLVRDFLEVCEPQACRGGTWPGNP